MFYALAQLHAKSIAVVPERGGLQRYETNFLLERPIGADEAQKPRGTESQEFPETG